MPENAVCHYYKTGKIVKATKDHIAPIAEDMRDMDALEVKCLGSLPLKALSDGLENSHFVFTVLDLKDNPLAMFGSGGKLNDAGYIWLLANNNFKVTRKDFVRVSKAWIRTIVSPFKFCGNLVHSQNKQALRWLKYCGAIFLSEQKIGNHLFYEFVIINNF